MSGDTVTINVSAQSTPEGFAETLVRFHAEHAIAVERERALSAVYSMANAIAWLAVLEPRRYLGWTRRRWVRARRAWNRERRDISRVVMVPQPLSDDQRASILAQIRETEPGWSGTIADPPPRTYYRLRPRDSFSEYVGRCLADGRVPMRGRRS